MREIKFRGKTLANFPDDKNNVVIPKGKWITGGIAFDEDRVWIDMPFYGQIIVEKDTVGQYTGLKDKNGKEIYEGDILQQIHYHYSNDEYGHKWFKKTIFQVLWDKKMAAFNFKAIKQTDIEMPENYVEPYREVIGNIYENPELLKEE